MCCYCTAVIPRQPGRIHKDFVMAKTTKQSSPKMSTLASKVLSGAKKPTVAQTRSLAASVLSQDEKKGQGKK